MRSAILLAMCLFILVCGWSQTIPIKGAISSDENHSPIEGATIKTVPYGQTAASNEQGVFYFKAATAPSFFEVSAIGYQMVVVSYADFIKAKNQILLTPQSIELREVHVAANTPDPYKGISKIDIQLKGINNAQEVLRMVPGLFIGQHAGGGKAEQIFLRGFDLDHGTDIAISVDGMPVNMVSHAHGQGYADLHFLIPELIENVHFKKGTYYPEKGNFTTTGAVDFRTMNTLPNNLIKVEGGQFNTFRGLGMLNLLPEKAKEKGQSAYIASEYMYTNGYFDNPQDFNRFNVYGKYYGKLNSNNQLSFSASAFKSTWNASGQIPERAVAAGIVGFFGAIDPNEGGSTSRANANLQLTTTLRNGGLLKNNLYYSRYHFELYSNFTFYKEDPVNGDQIRQKEARDLYGYSGSFTKIGYAGSKRITSELGANLRFDATQNSELSRTRDRNITTEAIRLGAVSEANGGAYINETIIVNPRLTINGGLRYDLFLVQYKDKLQNDTIGKTSASILSPKLNFYYHVNDKTQFYLTSGKGFHSNDARVVVPQNGVAVLPPAYGSDLGAVFKPAKNVLVNAALWYLWMQQEFVYVGDEGVVEPSGKSRRYGADVSVRYQPLSWLFLDADLNYAHGRSVDEPKGENYLPLAPSFTTIGGITVKTKTGLNGSLRYRHISNRPANAENTIIAKGYFITDAFINYAIKKIEIGLSIQNLFNVKWKETQFDTESRLKNELAPVSEIHFTPGTPFFAKLAVTYSF